MASSSSSGVPPGFRFHPTEEELLQYYLRKKVALERIDLEVIREVDLNKVEPWEIQGEGTQTQLVQVHEIFRKGWIQLLLLSFISPESNFSLSDSILEDKILLSLESRSFDEFSL